MDTLAEKVLDAIEANGHMAPSWIADKRAELKNEPRLEALKWICLSLDPINREHAAGAIGVSVEDLRATARVLRCG